MKWFKYLLLLIALFPLSTFALEEEGIIINCPKHINKGEDFECEVLGNAPYKVSALEYEFKLPNYLKKVDFKVDSSWQGTEEDDLVILYTDENKVSPFKIGIIKLNSSKDTSDILISTNYLLYGDDDYNEHLIKEKVDVKEVESVEEKNDNKKNNNGIYAIIIMIIVIIGIAILLIRRKKVRR